MSRDALLTRFDQEPSCDHCGSFSTLREHPAEHENLCQSCTNQLDSELSESMIDLSGHLAAIERVKRLNFGSGLNSCCGLIKKLCNCEGN